MDRDYEVAQPQKLVTFKVASEGKGGSGGSLV